MQSQLIGHDSFRNAILSQVIADNNNKTAVAVSCSGTVNTLMEFASRQSAFGKPAPGKVSQS